MSEHIRGLHSLTAISGAPQASIEFAVRTMGLRMVKRTVNYDDPQTYHLMFGNPFGEIGTILGLFPWRGAGSAYRGNGGTYGVSYRVPTGSLLAWQERLAEEGITATMRDGELTFEDPFEVHWYLQEDERVTSENAPSVWDGSSTPKDLALLGLGTVYNSTPEPAKTREFFATIGAQITGDEENFTVNFADDGSAASRAALTYQFEPEQQDQRHGAGSILKATLAVRSEEALTELRESFLTAGFTPSTVRNRVYWKAFFMQEPGGNVTEFATTSPGLTADEPLDELGLAFLLPEWLEQDREFLRGRLPVTASPEYADRFNPKR